MISMTPELQAGLKVLTSTCLPAGLGCRDNLTLDCQRNVDMATRRAALHSTQKLSSMRGLNAVPSSEALSNQWRPENTAMSPLLLRLPPLLCYRAETG